jgi:hypothetical protein
MATHPIAPAGMKRRPSPMSQILDLQAQLKNDALDAETTPAVRAQIARAWCDLQEERRKLQMRPLPKPIDVSDKRKHKNKTNDSGLSEA